MGGGNTPMLPCPSRGAGPTQLHHRAAPPAKRGHCVVQGGQRCAMPQLTRSLDLHALLHGSDTQRAAAARHVGNAPCAGGCGGLAGQRTKPAIVYDIGLTVPRKFRQRGHCWGFQSSGGGLAAHVLPYSREPPQDGWLARLLGWARTSLSLPVSPRDTLGLSKDTVQACAPHSWLLKAHN